MKDKTFDPYDSVWLGGRWAVDSIPAWMYEPRPRCIYCGEAPRDNDYAPYCSAVCAIEAEEDE